MQETVYTIDQRPTEFIDGFTIKTVIGAFFIGFIMLPGSIYLGLVAGHGLGAAATWVTVILFTEIARRSFTILKRQEIYILIYISHGLMWMVGGLALSGGPFAWLIWHQYLVKSVQAESFGIVNEIPKWVVPPPNSPALIQRTFFHIDWLPAILVLLITQVLGRLNWFGLGYLLFRLTSDIERLPFPMAPVNVQGAMALAEVSEKRETWRWRVFSVGSFIGLLYGFVYIFIPTFTGTIFTKPLQIIPIPFLDLTQNTEGFLPAALTGLSSDIGTIFLGFVIPFPIVAGSFISSILVNICLNPILYKFGLLTTWRKGMTSIPTSMTNSLDLWMSIGIGTAIAIAIIGLYSVTKSLLRRKISSESKKNSSVIPPPNRGDVPIKVALGLFLLSTLGYIILCHKLVPLFPVWLFIFYGFIFTPLSSYITARMLGITGHGIGFPYVREGTFILSGYKGIDIWFAPIPMFDHGGWAQSFREVELVGTKVTSIIKAELLMMPVILFCSLLFWSFIWKLGPIPSVLYPFAAKFWPLHAMFQCLWVTATREGTNWLLQAIKLKYIIPGCIGGLLFYPIINLLKLPVMFFYGLVGGIGAWPHTSIPMFAGSLLGRFVFRKRFGEAKWRAYAPVLLAGYFCGMGLIGMLGVAVALISKAVYQMPF